GGFPRRSRDGNDAASGPDRRFVRGRSPPPAHARRHEHRKIRRLRSPHPQGTQCRWRSRMRYGFIGLVLRVLLVFAVLTVWEILVRGLNVPAYILPPPTNIALALYRGFASTLYFGHIGVTLAETFMGFALGSALALSLGIAVALSRRVEYF